MRRPGSLAITLIIGALSFAIAGCSPPKFDTRVELPTTTTEQQLGAMRATPELQSLVEELSREASEGAVAGLSSAESKERVQAIVAEITRALVGEIATSVRGPATREAAAGMTRSMLHAFSDELTTSVGPAMRQMIVDELLRRPELREALNETARDVGKQIGLGSTEGVAEAAKHKKSRLLSLAADFLPSIGWLGLLLLVVLALGVPLAVLVKHHREERRYREDTERRTAVAAALLEAARGARDDPALDKLLSRIAASLAAPGAPPPTEAPRETSSGGTLHHA